MSWLATLLALPFLLAACGGGVSQEEFDAVQGDWRAEQARAQSSETQLQTEQARAQSLETQLQTEQARAQSLETQLQTERARAQSSETHLQTEQARAQSSETHLQTEQARAQSSETQLQTEQAQAAALQQRLDRGAAILGVLDILLGSFEDEDGRPSADDILEFSAVIQASGTPELQAKWVEISDSLLASAGSISPEALTQTGAVVQASGNVRVAEKWQEFLAAAARGEGGAAFLELGALIQDTGDPALQGLLLEIVEATLVNAEPPGELFGEFSALVQASGNVEIQETFARLGGLPPELLKEIGVKLRAIGDPNLEALFEATSQSPSGETFEAFFEGLVDGVRETLK